MSQKPLSDRDARRRLYSLMHRGNVREEAIHEVLQIGRDCLRVDHAYLGSIDEAGGHWKVVDSTYPTDGKFPEGTSADLRDTYCRKAIDDPDPLAFHNASDQGWAEDRAY